MISDANASPPFCSVTNKRLDPDRVAGERQALLELVPDRDRIHALEPRPGIVAPAEISGEDGLGIAVVGLEGVAALELAAKFGMIEDLAVEDDRVARVGAEDRLVPAFDVDDAEPAHPEAEIAVGEIAGVVGTAMANARRRRRRARPAAPACRRACTTPQFRTFGFSWPRRLMATVGMNDKTGKGLRVWALLGPHRGDNNQVLALAEALGLPFEEKWLSYNQLRRIQPGLLGATFRSVAAEARSAARRRSARPDDLDRAFEACRSCASFAADRAGRCARSISAIPRISPRHFDLVVPTPEYPVPDAPNVVRIPFALSPHRAREIDAGRPRTCWKPIRGPRRLFLIGGPDALLAASRRPDGGSRPAAARDRRKQRRLRHRRRKPEKPGRRAGCRALDARIAPSVPFLFAPNDGPPAYRALIEAADEIYVTADSVAMVADAVNDAQAGRNRADRQERARTDRDGRHRPASARKAAAPARPSLFLGFAARARLRRDDRRAARERSARLHRRDCRTRQAAFEAASGAGQS